MSKSIGMLATLGVFVLICFVGCATTSNRAEGPKTPCEKNYEYERNVSIWAEKSIEKASTKVKFPKMKSSALFNAAIFAVTENTYTVVSKDTEAGIISASAKKGKHSQAALAMQLADVDGGAVVTIKISMPPDLFGTIDGDPCKIISSMEEQLNVKAE